MGLSSSSHTKKYYVKKGNTLIFRHDFNQPLTNLLDDYSSVTHIYFGHEFNQPITDFLYNCPSLIYLGLDYRYNQKDKLPNNIKYLKINCNNMSLIENLPDSIEELEFGCNFNSELTNLPSSIKKIRFYVGSGFCTKYNKKLNCLPNGLTMLQLPPSYHLQIQNIPRGLKILICSKNYNFIGDFTGVQVKTY